MTQFITPLAVRHAKPTCSTGACDTATIKVVTAAVGFIGHGLEIGGNGGQREAVATEALQRRVAAVAACLAARDFLRQQALVLERDQSLGVEIAAMQTPQSHGFVLPRLSG